MQTRRLLAAMRFVRARRPLKMRVAATATATFFLTWASGNAEEAKGSSSERVECRALVRLELDKSCLNRRTRSSKIS